VLALDLVGRKLAAEGGAPLMAFFVLVKDTCKEAGQDKRLESVVDPLKAASKDLQAAAMFFMERGMKAPNDALAGSSDFLHLFGHVALGLVWVQMAQAAYSALDAGRSDRDFLEAKIATARYYAARHLPASALHLARIRSGADTVMALSPAQF
jgi:hypothetical protein